MNNLEQTATQYKIFFESFTKKFGDLLVLNNITFGIEDGEFLVIVGPTGCGKTTLAKLLIGLLEPTKGDIFINTSNVDNTPVSVLEAMACGLIIVSTNVGGIPHLLADEVNALLIPPQNPQAMTAAIQRVLTESDLAESLPQNARKDIEKFDWSVILPEQEKNFLELLYLQKNPNIGKKP